jgi:hypothetical protein
MKLRPQSSELKTCSRMKCASSLAFLTWLCFLATPETLSQNVELIMQTGGAQEGSASGYQIVGAVDIMSPNNPTESEFSLSTGVWSIQKGTVVSGNPPDLQITHQGAEVFVFWSLPAEGFILQVASGIDSEDVWNNVPAPYQNDGTHAQAVFVIEDGSQFFRLHRP